MSRAAGAQRRGGLARRCAVDQDRRAPASASMRAPCSTASGWSSDPLDRRQAHPDRQPRLARRLGRRDGFPQVRKGPTSAVTSCSASTAAKARAEARILHQIGSIATSRPSARDPSSRTRTGSAGAQHAPVGPRSPTEAGRVRRCLRDARAGPVGAVDRSTAWGSVCRPQRSRRAQAGRRPLNSGARGPSARSAWQAPIPLVAPRRA